MICDLLKSFIKGFKRILILVKLYIGYFRKPLQLEILYAKKIKVG